MDAGPCDERLLLAFNRSPADVAAIADLGPVNGFNAFIGSLLRVADAVSKGGDAKDTAAVGDQLAIF